MSDPSSVVDPNKPKWYQKKGFVIFMFLSVGPLALPLLWVNPKMSASSKWFWTFVTLAVTVITVVYLQQAVDKILTRYREMGLIS